jgi:hypothetical protein
MLCSRFGSSKAEVQERYRPVAAYANVTRVHVTVDNTASVKLRVGAEDVRAQHEHFG